MSIKQQAKQKQVRQLLRESFEPHETSRQALYHGQNNTSDFENIQNHDDGENIYKAFGIKPFFKKLRRQRRRYEDPNERCQLLTYDATYLNALIHLNDAEKAALERNDMSAFEHMPRTRRQVLKFLAEYPEHLSVQEDGGTDMHLYSKPGRGKTSFMNMIGAVRNLEINNDTVLWLLDLDELEILPLAPWTTILKPAGVETTVTAKPTGYQLPNVEIELTDVFRDVVEYTDPKDLFQKVVPGGMYGVLPDPKFRKCQKIVRAAYTSAWEAESMAEVTPVRDFAHAILEVRARDDVYLHPTTIIRDELGDLLPNNPEADENETRRKVKEWPKRYGKARKKGCSFLGASHTMYEVDEDVIRKERWFVQMPRTPVPSSSRAGIGGVPHTKRQVRPMEIGEAIVWDSESYNHIGWTNPYRRYEWHGEIDISYPGMERAIEAIDK